MEKLFKLKAHGTDVKTEIRAGITTFFAMAAVSVVSLVMGVDSILSFSVPMMFGIVVGTYNSLCFVPSLWVWWQKKRGVKTLQTKSKAKSKK